MNFRNYNDITCRTCPQVYQTYEGNFSRQKGTKSGFKYICKICCAADSKKRREATKLKALFYTGEWMGSEEREQMEIYKELTIKNK